MELFKSAAGLNILHIPYKGNAPLTVALLSEEVSLSMDTLAISLTQIKQGKFRAIAVTGAKRHPLLPDVPTLAESGLKGFQYEGWQGVFAPAKTSSVIIDQLIQAIKKISSMPAVIHRIYELGYEPVNISQEDFVKVISSEVIKYSKFVKDSKIQAE
jgi:tripartite-type tricarboxylate transporter receptor subunit TctC